MIKETKTEIELRASIKLLRKILRSMSHDKDVEQGLFFRLLPGQEIRYLLMDLKKKLARLKKKK